MRGLLVLVVVFFFTMGGDVLASRDANPDIADAIVHGADTIFAPNDPWLRLLLYTPPFQGSVVTQAVLIVQFSIRLSIHNYRDDCTAYGEAVVAAFDRLRSLPDTGGHLARGWTHVSAADFRGICERAGPSPIGRRTAARAMLHAQRVLQVILPDERRGTF